MEAVTEFIFLGSKITGDSDCSHEIKRCLLLGRKAVTDVDSVLRRFADRRPCSQSYGFFQQSCTDVSFGPQKRLSTKELMLSNCAGEYS